MLKRISCIMKIVIDINNLSVYYGQNKVFDNISFAAEKGDFVGLVGPNGGGKTTLAKAILGLIPKTKGRILFFGKELRKFDEFSKIGYLPQKQSSINQLFPATVGEVVFLGLLSQKRRPKRISQEDGRQIDQTLSLLRILNLKNKMLSELSGGQQQKALLARALVSNPELLILDEPSTALDPVSRKDFFKLVKKLNQEAKTTIILITHDTGYIGQYANKLLYIDRKLVFFGKISDFCQGTDISSCFEKSDRHIIWHQHK